MLAVPFCARLSSRVSVLKKTLSKGLSLRVHSMLKDVEVIKLRRQDNQLQLAGLSISSTADLTYGCIWLRAKRIFTKLRVCHRLACNIHTCLFEKVWRELLHLQESRGLCVMTAAAEQLSMARWFPARNPRQTMPVEALMNLCYRLHRRSMRDPGLKNGRPFHRMTSISWQKDHEVVHLKGGRQLGVALNACKRTEQESFTSAAYHITSEI